MNDGELDGMQSFDRVLERLAREGAVSVGTALQSATNRTNLQLKLDTQSMDAAAKTEAAATIGTKDPTLRKSTPTRSVPKSPVQPKTDFEDLIER